MPRRNRAFFGSRETFRDREGREREISGRFWWLGIGGLGALENMGDDDFGDQREHIGGLPKSDEPLGEA